MCLETVRELRVVKINNSEIVRVVATRSFQTLQMTSAFKRNGPQRNKMNDDELATEKNNKYRT